MVIHGPNGDFENKDNYSIKKQSGSEIKRSDKPTNEEIVSQMKSKSNSANIPMGFMLYREGTDEQAHSSDIPESDEPTAPQPPDEPTLYGPPEPDEPTAPQPPDEPNTGIGSLETSSIPKGRADGHTIARNDDDFYKRFPRDKFEIIYKQGNMYFFKKIN